MATDNQSGTVAYVTGLLSNRTITAAILITSLTGIISYVGVVQTQVANIGAANTDASKLVSGILSTARLPSANGDVTGPYTALTVNKIGGQAPAAVATSGNYADLTNRPTIPSVSTLGTSGNLSDSTGTLPASKVTGLGAVATTNSYGDLSGKLVAGTDFISPFGAVDKTTVRGAPVFLSGLVDDGATDNTAIVQAAVNASASVGVCLYVPESTTGYALASAISLPSHSCLLGAGEQTHFLAKAGFPSVASLFGTASGATDISVSNLSIDGNKANQTGTFSGFNVNSGRDVSLDHVMLYNFPGNGYTAAGTTTNFKVTNSIAHDNAAAGITVNTGTNGIIQGIIAYNNGTHGVGCIGTAHHMLFDTIIAYDNGTNSAATADNFTCYNAGNDDITLSNFTGLRGGNHVAHGGGNHFKYINIYGDSPLNQGVFHGAKAVYNTGTASVTNGSTTVTGTGTTWTGICSNYGSQTIITIGGTATRIQHIDSATSLTVAAWSGATQTNATYSLTCYVPTTDIVMKNIEVTGMGAGRNAVWIDQAQGFELDAETNDASGSGGAVIYGSSNGHVTGSFNNKTNLGLGIYPEEQYNTGTVAVTNGSPTVTGTGTTFRQSIADASLFFVNGDLTAPYTVQSVDSDTQVTLASNYAGATASGKAYELANIPTTGLDIDVTANGNGSGGIKSNMLLNSKVSGTLNNNSPYGYYEVYSSGNQIGPVTAIGNPTAYALSGTSIITSLWNGSAAFHSALALTPGAPASDVAACSFGQIKVDGTYVYVCAATNTWKRAALSAY